MKVIIVSEKNGREEEGEGAAGRPEEYFWNCARCGGMVETRNTFFIKENNKKKNTTKNGKKACEGFCGWNCGAGKRL